MSGFSKTYHGLYWFVVIVVVVVVVDCSCSCSVIVVAVLLVQRLSRVEESVRNVLEAAFNSGMLPGKNCLVCLSVLFVFIAVRLSERVCYPLIRVCLHCIDVFTHFILVLRFLSALPGARQQTQQQQQQQLHCRG